VELTRRLDTALAYTAPEAVMRFEGFASRHRCCGRSLKP
jgi:hypothetical protein